MKHTTSISEAEKFDENLLGSCISSPRAHSSLQDLSQPETYTVASEKRLVDEVSQRHLIEKNIGVDEFVKIEKPVLDDLISQSVDLGTLHSVQNFEPTIEVLHHLGDKTKLINVSDLPDVIYFNSEVSKLDSARSHFDTGTNLKTTSKYVPPNSAGYGGSEVE